MPHAADMLPLIRGSKKKVLPASLTFTLSVLNNVQGCVPLLGQHVPPFLVLQNMHTRRGAKS